LLLRVAIYFWNKKVTQLLMVPTIFQRTEAVPWY
jgi:hypothetical protein